MTEVERVEAILREAIERKIAEGWRLAPDVFSNIKERKCCALGALSLTDGWTSVWTGYANLLRITPMNAEHIADGFDAVGQQRRPTDEWFALGAKLRREYVK